MKFFLPVVFLLLFSNAAAKPKPSFEDKCHRVTSVWNNIWAISDYSKNLKQMEETSEIIYSEDEFNKHLKNRKIILRGFEKALKGFKQTERSRQYAYFRNSLQDAIRSGDEERILSQANLYIQMLPDDSIQTKLLLYTRILLPVYFDRHEMAEMYYVYKVLEGVKPVQKDDTALLRQSREYVLNRYRSLKENMPTKDYLKGMWVSSDYGKKNLPDFILNVIEKDSVFYGVLSRHSAFMKKNRIGYSIASPFMIDSAYRVTLQYHHIERREGMSEAGVQAANTMIDAVGQGVVKSVYSNTALSSLGKQGIGAGIQFLSNILMSSVGNASRVTDTNRTVYLNLQPGTDRDILPGDYLLKKTQWFGDPALKPAEHSENGLLRFYRLNPDDEILFVGEKGTPIVYPCRSVYFHSEGWSVYKKAWGHRRKIGWQGIATAGNHGYNKKMQRMLQSKYKPQTKKK